ncbi:MAG: 2-phosphosulfolactate phosphatase [Clostridia bacterium]|nr:2-phosphosulfolactate phosphatase [Clostridia bacterium]
MIIRVLATTNHITRTNLTGQTAVVLDILRSTTCIVTALANGCRGVIPALNRKEAQLIAQCLETGSYALAGEDKGQKIADFPLGNSPQAYQPNQIKDKYIIMATTNGTASIIKSAGAQNVIIASFLNMRQVSRQIAQIHNNIAIVCAGTQGKFSLEDTLAAGMLIHLLKNARQEYTLSDLALTAETLYLHHHENLLQTLQTSQNGRYLISHGLLDDISFAAQIDLFPIIPVYESGIVRKADS